MLTIAANREITTYAPGTPMENRAREPAREPANSYSRRASQGGHLETRQDWVDRLQFTKTSIRLRLIDLDTMEMRMFTSPGEPIPKYAILSHRWLPDNEEISYQDFVKKRNTQRSGYRKIVDFCSFVKSKKGFRWPLRKISFGEYSHWDSSHWPIEEPPKEASDFFDEISHIWIDTCCIDKTSSAELSESINSMYRYYVGAHVCVVYLSDVTSKPCGLQWCGQCDECDETRQQVDRSEWFQRGWTLQELVAPATRVFLSKSWEFIGGIFDKRKYSNQCTDALMDCVSEITRIPKETLTDCREVQAASIAQRLSWANNRSTTRVEDRSYSLFGLLGVNMPLLYGEGDRAWLRLQQEIVRTSCDESIFAWQPDGSGEPAVPGRSTRQGRSVMMIKPHLRGFTQPILAPSPECFAHCGKTQFIRSFERLPYTVTNQGLELKLGANSALISFDPRGRMLAVPLNCGSTPNSRAAAHPETRMLMLQRRPECGHYERLGCPEIRNVPEFCRSIDRSGTDWIECDDEVLYIHAVDEICGSDPRSGQVATSLPCTPHLASVLAQMHSSPPTSWEPMSIYQSLQRQYSQLPTF